MKKKVVYVYPFYGELGWELFNWLPYVNYVCDKNKDANAVIVNARSGREGLYEHIANTTFYSFDGYENCTEGNSFVVHRPDAYSALRKKYKSCDSEVAAISNSNSYVIAVRLPTDSSRYYKIPKDKKLHLPLIRVSYNPLIKCVPDGCIIVHMRLLSRSSKKNTKFNSLNAVIDWASAHNKTVVAIGKSDISYEPINKHCINLIDKTSLTDVIALYNRASVVVGSSSGPMHLAALTKTPYIVWGGERSDVADRYTKSWNPFNVKHVLITTSWTVKNSTLTDTLDKFFGV